MEMILPNFLVIGIAKGGTTTLFHWLQQHAEISLPYQKEIHFFDNEGTWERGYDYYMAQFVDCKGAKAIGDISPGYFENSHKVIPRVKSFFCDNAPKIVLLLRDPVERAYSYWNFRTCYYGENRSFEELFTEYVSQSNLGLQPVTFDYFSDGFYAAKLQAWQNAFGTINLKTILTDDLSSRPNEILESLFNFLGVDPYIKVNTNELKNVASQPRSHFAMKLLNSPPSMIRKIGRLLLPASIKRDIRQKLYELNARPGRKSSLDGEVERNLRALHREDILKTGKLIERNLDHWIS